MELLSNQLIDIRWLRCDIKSLNLLGSVLSETRSPGSWLYEAILHRDGLVTEGSSTNMFGIKDGVVYTHPATNLILEGITRQVVLRSCAMNLLFQLRKKHLLWKKRLKWMSFFNINNFGSNADYGN